MTANVRSTARLLAVISAILGCALLTAGPAHAADPARVVCDDGSAGGIDGHTAESECATIIAELTALGCTVDPSDEPNGAQDTLTVDCSAAAPTHSFVRKFTAVAGVVPRLGTLTKSEPKREIIYSEAKEFSCLTASWSVGYSAAEAENERVCGADVARQVNAWSEGYHNSFSGDPRWDNIHTTVRCNSLNSLHHAREYGPLFDVTTSGTMKCTLLVWGVDLR